MGDWGPEVDAGLLVASTGTQVLATTSTSTVLLRHGTVFSMCWFRTYGLLDEALGAAGLGVLFDHEGADSLNPRIDCATFERGSSMNRWITFVDSAAEFVRTGAGAYTDADFPLVLQPTYPPLIEHAEALVQRTCVPHFKSPGIAWPYSHRVYDLASCTYTTVEYREKFWVTYKDVSVVKIPSRTSVAGLVTFPGALGDGHEDEQEGGGYLMVAVRTRILVSEGEDVVGVGGDPIGAFGVGWNPPHTVFSLGGPGTCLADIVCFYADDAEFRTNVKGPYLLVHSAYALDTQPHARLWLGVPGAAFHKIGGEWWLYVYYQCEPHDPAGAQARLDLAVAVGGAPSALQETAYADPRDAAPACTGSITESYGSISVPQGGTEENASGQSLFMDVTSGIAVSRFRLSDVQSEIVDAAAIPESEWSIYTSTMGWTGAVAGEQLGYIYVWMCGGLLGPTQVQMWEGWVQGATQATGWLHKADPAPMDCGSRLVLFFAANEWDSFSGVASPPLFQYKSGGPFSGHGIWRCVAMEEGTSLDFDGDGKGEFPILSYGKHFFCDATIDLSAPATVLALGQVVHTKTQPGMALDPDPVQLPDGSARVYFGQGQAALEFVSGPSGIPCANVEPALVAGFPVPMAVVGRPPAEGIGRNPDRGAWLQALADAMHVGARP